MRKLPPEHRTPHDFSGLYLYFSISLVTDKVYCFMLAKKRSKDPSNV
jgi:hypothetical protein